MRVATMVSSGKDLTFENGQFVLEGQPLPLEKAAEYDGLGILQWVSPETKTWFDGLRSQPAAVPAVSPFRDPRVGPAIQGRKLLLVGAILGATSYLLSMVAPVAARATGLDTTILLVVGGVASLLGLLLAIIGFLRVAPIMRMPGIAKVLLGVALVLFPVLGFVPWAMAKNAIASPAPMLPEGKSNTNRNVAIIAVALAGVLILAGGMRIGRNMLNGVGPGEAIGTAMPPNEVLVNGATYTVWENKAGTSNIRRGDKVKVEFRDIDYDGENDGVDILELLSVAGQE